MAKARTTPGSRYEARERRRGALAHVVVALAGGKARLVVLLVAVLLAAWQLYIFAWQPLSAEANLPAGIASVRARLDIDSLTTIRDARTQRLQRTPNLFSDADQYFVDSVPAPP